MCSHHCNICTGCGRCAGVKKELSVLTSSRISEEPVSLENPEGKRLVAVDIGTTTIAMQLFGPDGVVQEEFAVPNPQAAYGADVLSRVQAAGNADNAVRMQCMVRDVLSRGLSRFIELIGRNESLFMVIAANTTMVYLLMGYDTEELGHAPFAASRLGAAKIVIDGVPGVCFPGLSAFVGGDITAGIHACKAAEREELTLLIDLGTNGEIVLGNRRRIVACATAAGPAFEGGASSGVWGADMVSLLARLRREGVLDETGLLADAYFDEGILIGNVRVTQAAVRAVQMAKGAILAGIHILAQEYGVELGEIDRVVLAGGFGYYLEPQSAGEIGLLPPVLAGRAETGGNTALAGALRLGRQILCEGYQGDCLKEHWESQGCRIDILNLAAHPRFEELYIRSMALEETEAPEGIGNK